MKLELKVGQRFEAIDLEGETLEVVEGGLLKIVEPKKGKFVPKYDEHYWFITNSGMLDDTYIANKYDEWLVNHQPVFRTKEEAEEYKRYLDVLDKYKYEFSDEEWYSYKVEKWVLSFDVENDGLDCCETYTRKHPNCIYFKSLEDAEAFIKEVGEENVKKFMFDVWD